jgi:hypothetical protein
LTFFPRPLLTAVVAGASVALSVVPSPPGRASQATWLGPSLVPAPQTTNRQRIDRCFPPWMREDIRMAAKTHLPVPTLGIGANLSAYPYRLTVKNLAAWLAEPLGTQPTPASLLARFRVGRLKAVAPFATFQLIPGRDGDTFLVEESHPTKFQARQLAPGELPSVARADGPVTLSWWLPPGPKTVKAGLLALIRAAKAQGGQPIDAYVAGPRRPPVHSYWSYAGPLHPASWLGPPPSGEFVCMAGLVSEMGLQDGLIQPVPVRTVLDANGIMFGLAPGYVVIMNGHAGMISILWYRIPAIRVPAAALRKES